MNISKNVVGKAWVFGMCFLAVSAVMPVSQALANPPNLPPLTPPPPPYYTCQPTGHGAICRADRVDQLEQIPSGLLCGTAANPVELLLSGTDNFALTRYYNTDGNQTRRTVHEHFDATILNPATGLTALTTQIAEFVDTFAVPGDPATVTFQQTGVVKFYLPGSGVLLRDVGRAVIGPDGNDVFDSGQHQLGAYFGGDHSVLASLCATLGSPGTP
jgi:hypothetical protein